VVCWVVKGRGPHLVPSMPSFGEGAHGGEIVLGPSNLGSGIWRR
jgi:hypothetical protein